MKNVKNFTKSKIFGRQLFEILSIQKPSLRLYEVPIGPNLSWELLNGGYQD